MTLRGNYMRLRGNCMGAEGRGSKGVRLAGWGRGGELGRN